MGRKMNENPSYYAILTADVRYSKDLKPMEKILYSEITALANMNGVCYATNKYFANLFDTSEETVSRWISNLRKYGFLMLKFHYLKGTKSIEKREITPIDKKVNTYCEKDQEAIDKKVKDNNTLTESNISLTDSLKKTSKKEIAFTEARVTREPFNHEIIQAGNFEEFWQAYPRKEGKGKARMAFFKAVCKVNIHVMLTALDIQCKSQAWQKDNGKYIPNPANWLDGERWLDEVKQERNIAEMLEAVRKWEPGKGAL